MNKTIAKLFEKTSDALLVDAELGMQIPDNAITFILLDGKQEAILKAAQDKKAAREASRK